MAVGTARHEGLGLMGGPELRNRMAAHAGPGLARLEQRRRARAMGHMTKPAVLGDGKMLMDPGAFLLGMTAGTGRIAWSRSAGRAGVGRMAVGTGQQALAHGMVRRQVEARRDLGMTVDAEPRPGVRPGKACCSERRRGAEMAGICVMRIVAAAAEQSRTPMGRGCPVEMAAAAALVAVEAGCIAGEANRLGRPGASDVERARAVALLAAAMILGRRLMAVTALAVRITEPFGRSRDGLDPLVAMCGGVGLEPGTGRGPEEHTCEQSDDQQPA